MIGGDPKGQSTKISLIPRTTLPMLAPGAQKWKVEYVRP